MRILLDTHARLLWWTDAPQLSATPRSAIANEAFVSAASAWEVSTRQRLGKLGGVPEAHRAFSELVLADGFGQLPTTHLHALRAGGYPQDHRDPFDRMLRRAGRSGALGAPHRRPGVSCVRHTHAAVTSDFQTLITQGTVQRTGYAGPAPESTA